MSKPISILRKFAAALVGVPIILLGIVLVPLPGPGLLIMFAGLFILSLEFDGAKKYSDKARSQIKGIFYTALEKSKTHSDKQK